MACGRVGDMDKAFDIGLERLMGTSAGAPKEGTVANVIQKEAPKAAQEKRNPPTFYLETFGCQMNEHDSEKVAGVLLAT